MITTSNFVTKALARVPVEKKVDVFMRLFDKSNLVMYGGARFNSDFVAHRFPLAMAPGVCFQKIGKLGVQNFGPWKLRSAGVGTVRWFRLEGKSRKNGAYVHLDGDIGSQLTMNVDMVIPNPNIDQYIMDMIILDKFELYFT